jgi:DNA repair exonuclease SbcCD ATPase subunit
MSLYLDNSDHNPLKPSRRQSIGSSDVEYSSDDDDDDDFVLSTPKKKKTQKRRSDSHLVQNLQHRLRASEKEIARLCRLTMDQADRMEDIKGESKKMRDKLKNANRDKQDLINQVHNLELELDKRTKMLYERQAHNSSSNDNTNNTGTKRRNSGSSDLLVAQICELEDEKRKMVAKMDAEKAMARSRLESKEEEVRFLQEELERMRAVQGDKQLEYMQKMASLSDDDESLSASKRGLDRGPSLQFVGKILGNHLKDKAETEIALQQQEIRDLQDRVSDLLMSNEKLKAELKRVTLEIKDDDDEEIRRAKEAAAQASQVAAQYQPSGGNHLRDKVMSLSRLHRANSEGERSIADSFRLNHTSHR